MYPVPFGRGLKLNLGGIGTEDVTFITLHVRVAYFVLKTLMVVVTSRPARTKRRECGSRFPAGCTIKMRLVK